MGKKIALIIASVIAVAGIGTCIAGFVSEKADSTGGKVIDINDPSSFVPGVSGKVHLYSEDLFEVEKGLSTYTPYELEEYEYSYIVSGIDTNPFAIGRYLVPKDDQGRLIYNVKVMECPDETWQKVYDFIIAYYERLYAIVSEDPEANPEYLESLTATLSDEGREALRNSISHTMCEVTPSVNYAGIKLTGIIIAAVGLLAVLSILLSYKLKARQIVLGYVVLVIAGLLVMLFAVRKQIATILSLKEYQPGAYTIKYTADYKLDDMLEAGVTDEAGLLSWAGDKLFYGLPVSMNGNTFGCAAFLVTDENGNHLMGRNLDYPEADCLMIYTDPKDGYDSIAMVDLSIVNIGSGEGQMSPTSLTGKAAALAAPYFVVEGMNETGLGVSILELETEEIHQDTGKQDILINVAVRAVLDKCATVDEAVAFFEKYDMNTMLGTSFHLFVCDKTGKSVVVEWFGDKMYVKENPAVTNYVVCTTDAYIDPGNDTRYEDLMKELDSCSRVADPKKAMSFLEMVGYDNKKGSIGTEWSCVYDLDNFTVTVCFDVKYGEPVFITKDSFK